MESKLKRNIWHMTARIAFKKGKRLHERNVWIVTKYETPGDIMGKDNKTMSRLSKDIYGKSYKGVKSIIIRELIDKIKVGETWV